VELSIKASLGKLRLEMPFIELVSDHVTANAIDLLTIKPEHLDTLTTLPFHHKDPFDRLIIAQSLTENIPVLGKDRIFNAYGVERLWKQTAES
jgi:PIN domain nuclease of toxin-antitoxin system